MEYILLIVPAIISLTLFEAVTKKRDMYFRFKYISIVSVAILLVASYMIHILKGEGFDFNFNAYRGITMAKSIVLFNAISIVGTILGLAINNFFKLKLEKSVDNEKIK